MKEKIELPVNKKGFMRANEKQAALYSIMTSKEYSGELNAVVSNFIIETGQKKMDYFSEAEKFEHQLKCSRLDLDKRNNELRFYSHPYTENKYAYLYQDIEEDVLDYSIEVKIDYIQNSDAWSQVKIIFSNGIWAYNRKTRAAYFENECALELTSQGRLYFNSPQGQKKTQLYKFEMEKSIFLKLEKKSCIIVKYSFDGMQWNTLLEEKCGYLEFNEAGLFIEPKINTFFYDFFTCNTQLFYDIQKNQIFTFPKLEYDNRYFSNMLEAYSIPCELISESDIEFIMLFEKFIENAFYIFIKLQKLSIFYGFDRKKRVFKRMTLNQGLEFSEISFDNFLMQYCYEKQSGECITLYKYKSWRYPNSINKEIMILNLKAYIEGKSSCAVTTRKQILYFMDKPFIYGVKIYERIAQYDDYMELFLSDANLSAQIYEHYLIMLKMLDFINHIDIISDEQYKKRTTGFRALTRISSCIKNIVFRIDMDRKEEIKKKLIVLFQELRKKDETETRELIEDLIHYKA